MSAREPVHRSHLVTSATPREVYDIVVDFAASPRLFPELKGARVVSTQGSVVRVEFRAQMVLPVRYVLDLTCQPDVPSVDWRGPMTFSLGNLRRRIKIECVRPPAALPFVT